MPEKLVKSLISKTDTLSIYRGILDEQIDELINHSTTDPEIQKYTPDNIRFKDRMAYEVWFKKGRTLYTLIDSRGSLTGIIWFGPSKFDTDVLTEAITHEDYPLTFAIRTYPPLRGRGVARPFMECSFTDYTKQNEFINSKSKGIWLDVHNDNSVAINLYKTFGFRVVSTPHPEHKRIVMVWDKQ
jgi:GNAT superfamily N-acetyltransferase